MHREGSSLSQKNCSQNYYDIYGTDAPSPDSEKDKDLADRNNEVSKDFPGAEVSAANGSKIPVDAEVDRQEDGKYGHLRYGFTIAFYRICNESRLTEDLTAVFGNKASKLIAIAVSMIKNGTDMVEMQSWQEEIYLPCSAPTVSPFLAKFSLCRNKQKKAGLIFSGSG